MKKIVLFFGVCLLLLTSCSSSIEQYRKNQPLFLKLKEGTPTYEYGQFIDINDLVEDTNADSFYLTDYYSPILRVGTQTITIEAVKSSGNENKDLLLGKEKLKVKIDVLVTDTKPPKIEYNPKDLEITVGDTILFDEKIKGIDEVDGKTAIRLYKQPDLSVVGEYQMEVLAVDKNGLSTTEMVTVKVKDKEGKIPTPQPTSSVETPPVVEEDNSSDKWGHIIEIAEDSSKQLEHIPPTVNEPTPVLEAPSTNTVVPEGKQFLFSDGYNFDSADQSCLFYLAEVVEKGYQGIASCLPIQDEKGIYLGFEAMFR